MSGAGPPFGRDARVGIIGGGASGLTAAHALRQLGYGRVTVLEQEARVGGKCCTLVHGGRSYELGAGLVTPAYRRVRALMREVGVVGSIHGGELRVGLRDVAERLARGALRPSRWAGGASEVARFGLEMARHPWLYRPGFEAADEELAQPFDRWCRARRCEGARALVEPWVTGFGYGRIEDIPAAYVLKYATLFAWPLLELSDDGYEGLFRRVASALHPVEVRQGTRVVQIARDARGATVRTTDGSMRFDALVIACPVDEALAFLDASPGEVELFERVRYRAYFVLGAGVSGSWPRDRYTFLRENFGSDAVGQPVFAYRRWPASDVVFFYGFEREAGGEAAARREVAATVDRLGGRLGEVIALRRWRYFPHVQTDDIAAGYYRRLEALQGARRTYYCGELFAFASVETVVAYARALVRAHFATRPLRAGTGAAPIRAS